MGNQNTIIIDRWSNPDAEALYRTEWPNEPAIRARKLDGEQCGGCSYVTPFNAGSGSAAIRTHVRFRETDFEHFTCLVFLGQGVGLHTLSARSTPRNY